MKLLRWALIVDAVASGLIGIGDVALNRMMSDLLGVPRGLLYGLGAVLIAWDVALLVLATRRTVNRPAVGVVIALNLIWALDSVVMVEAEVQLRAQERHEGRHRTDHLPGGGRGRLRRGPVCRSAGDSPGTGCRIAGPLGTGTSPGVPVPGRLQ